jgi:hypothetical protein
MFGSIAKKALIGLGLRAAPKPWSRYATASSVVGVVPVMAYAAWKNRAQLKALYDRTFHRGASPGAAAL